MKNFGFELNQEVKDVVTGFKGIIMGRTEYNTGCIQYGVLPQELGEGGKVPDWHWFDETRLIATGKKIEIQRADGGPHPLAPSM
jgi:hypothetical protein